MELRTSDEGPQGTIVKWLAGEMEVAPSCVSNGSPSLPPSSPYATIRSVSVDDVSVGTRGMEVTAALDSSQHGSSTRFGGLYEGPGGEGTLSFISSLAEHVFPSNPLMRERRTLLRGKLRKLQQELQDPDGEAGEVNMYGVALLQVVVARSWKAKVYWTTLAIVLALVEVFALLSIAVGSTYPKCVYDDDCPIGTACIFVRREADSYYRQPICVDCNHLVTLERADPGWLPMMQSLLSFNSNWPGHMFTPASTGDRWSYASTSAEFCENYLSTPFVTAWTDGTSPLTRRNITDFSLCLHVQEALHRFGFLDHCTMLLAFFLVCVSVSSDRKQQLFNKYLRQMLLPPPWADPYAAAFYLVELLLAALLPTVLLTMILLLYSGSSMQATDALLNGVAIAFVLVIDDELPTVLLLLPPRPLPPHLLPISESYSPSANRPSATRCWSGIAHAPRHSPA